MKKIGLVLGVFALFMFAFGATISAQGKRGNKEENAEKRFEKMKERLKLTDSQVTQIEEINKTYAALVSEAKTKEYSEQRDKMKAVRKIRKEQDDKVAEILDDTQKIEWEKMREEKKAKMKERRGKRKDNRG